MNEERVAIDAPGATAWYRDAAGCTGGYASGVRHEIAGGDVEPGDRFRIGSITKTFNGALALLLERDGVLSLDDAVGDHLPGANGADITLEQLLRHTAGIPNFVDTGPFLTQMTVDVAPEDVVQWSWDLGVTFEPGQGWAYSNTGYFVFALVVEAATGQPWDAVLRERILDPWELSLHVEGFEDGAAPIPGHLSRLPTTESFSTHWSWAAGALVSDGQALLAWADLLFAGDLLTESERSRLLQPTVLPDGREVPYGLGVQLRTWDGAEQWGHTGSTMGFQSELFADAETGEAIAVLVNDFNAEATDVGLAIWSTVTARR